MFSLFWEAVPTILLSNPSRGMAKGSESPMVVCNVNRGRRANVGAGIIRIVEIPKGSRRTGCTLRSRINVIRCRGNWSYETKRSPECKCNAVLLIDREVAINWTSPILPADVRNVDVVRRGGGDGSCNRVAGDGKQQNRCR